MDESNLFYRLLIINVVASFVSLCIAIYTTRTQSKNTNNIIESTSKNIDKTLNQQRIFEENKQKHEKFIQSEKHLHERQLKDHELKLAKIEEIYELIEKASVYLENYKKHEIFNTNKKEFIELEHPNFLQKAVLLNSLYLKDEIKELFNLYSLLAFDIRETFKIISFFKGNEKCYLMSPDQYSFKIAKFKYHPAVLPPMDIIFDDAYSKSTAEDIPNVVEDAVEVINQVLPAFDKIFYSEINSALLKINKLQSQLRRLIHFEKQDTLVPTAINNFKEKILSCNKSYLRYKHDYDDSNWRICEHDSPILVGDIVQLSGGLYHLVVHCEFLPDRNALHINVSKSAQTPSQAALLGLQYGDWPPLNSNIKNEDPKIHPYNSVRKLDSIN